MPTYLYRCRSGCCPHWEELEQGYHDAPLTVCPSCGAPTLARVPQLPLLVRSVTPADSPLSRGAERPFAQPYVTYERDGSETVYRSEAALIRGERERTGSLVLADKNLGHVRRLGYVEGTRSAAFREAVKPLAPGDVVR